MPTEAERAAATDLIAELRRILAGVIKAQQQLTVISQRQQMQADAFRTRKEALKAAYSAAQASQLIDQAAGQHRGGSGAGPEGSGSPVTGAAAWLREITDQIEQELRRQPPTEALMELRPGAPATAASASCSPSSPLAPRC